jgi:hypothetical protein
VTNAPRTWVRIASLVAIVVAAGATTFGALAATTKSSQTSFFKSLLLDDRSTAPGIAKLLRTDAGFVESNVIFADLTGDSKADAVVRVAVPGAAGTVAVYVFSTDGVKPNSKGESKLRAIYRNQSQYRASASVRSGALLLRVPKWKVGEEPCCPATLSEREYLWRASDHRLHLHVSRDIPGPGAPPQTRP